MPAITSTERCGSGSRSATRGLRHLKVTAEGMFGSDASIMKEIVANKADAAIVGVAG